MLFSLAALLRLPFRDAWRGLDRCLTRERRAAASFAGVLLGLLAGWWLYVPIHELLHAAACLAAGGEVTRLEIDGLYGGALLARLFPFVTSGSSYAGRLSGFNTRGSDLIYLATDLGPFLLTLMPGVWGLRRAASDRRPFLFGALLPFALAPFLSLTGDAYEIGSILTSHLPAWSAPALRTLLRGDDLGVRCGIIWSQAAGSHPPVAPALAWSGLALATVLGMLWASLTYAAGAGLARLAGAAAVPPGDPRDAAP